MPSFFVRSRPNMMGMQEEVRGTDVELEGPLRADVGAAGRGVELRLQHHITRQREQTMADALR